MSYSKIYCLKCERISNCLCHNDDYHLYVAPKLRVPPSTRNKVKFRKFLNNNSVSWLLTNNLGFRHSHTNHDGWDAEKIAKLNKKRKAFKELLYKVKYFENQPEQGPLAKYKSVIDNVNLTFADLTVKSC